MQSKSEATDGQPEGAKAPAAYEPPQVKVLGSVHDLLAMAKSQFDDCAKGGKGDDFFC